MEVFKPTTTVDNGLTFRRTFDAKARRIEIRSLGRGHTRGDLVVVLPEERIVAAGDLLVAPVPLVGGDQSYPEEWIETLGRLQALGAKTFLPGHGPVLRDEKQLVLYREFLLSVLEQTRAAMTQGLSPEDAIAAVDVTTFRDRMAGENPVLRMLFANWGRVPAVTALYRVRDEEKGSQP
jgi:glyoxylase-like metal-dependent hydrolase (beta-lactamase superfamily II)